MVQQGARGDAGDLYPLVDLAAANAWAGHDKEAKEAVAQLQKVYPGFTVQTWAGIHWTDDPTFNAQYARIVEGLRKAGLPEGEKTTIDCERRPLPRLEAPAGAGAMLVACRLAGLSALEGHYAGSERARNAGRRGAPMRQGRRHIGSFKCRTCASFPAVFGETDR